MSPEIYLRAIDFDDDEVNKNHIRKLINVTTKSMPL